MNLTEKISPQQSPINNTPLCQNSSVNQIGREATNIVSSPKKNNDLDSEQLEDFKGKVKKWLELDNEIKALDAALKLRKKNRKELQANIMDFMGKFNMKDMNTDDGILTYNETKTKKPINKEFIQKTLNAYFKSEQDSNNITNYLFENRETVSKFSLKRKK